MRTLFLFSGLLIILWIAFYFVVPKEEQEIATFSPTGESSEDNEPATLPPLSLYDRTITYADGTKGTFRVPEGFDVAVAMEGLGKARFMALSPDGKLFVGDMVNFEDSRQGSIFMLENFNSETKRFEKKTTYATGLRNPHSIAFYTDKDNKQWIYIAETHQLIRYPYRADGETVEGEPQVVYRFKDYRTVDGDVWHITRTILFPGEKLFVSIGSSCNICEEPEDEERAMILVMDPEGNDARVYASGLRNAVGMAFMDDSLYATLNGVDHRGEDNPNDVVYRLEEGKNYGFPYCYPTDEGNKAETGRNWSRTPIPCEDVPSPFTSLGAHTAPLGITYMKEGNSAFANSFLIALHGSWRPELKKGFSIVRVGTDGSQEVFIDGFIKENLERIARPVDILQHDDNSFFFTDDHKGRLYYVFASSGDF